jgi:hypothetical protein
VFHKHCFNEWAYLKIQNNIQTKFFWRKYVIKIHDWTAISSRFARLNYKRHADQKLVKKVLKKALDQNPFIDV